GPEGGLGREESPESGGDERDPGRKTDLDRQEGQEGGGARARRRFPGARPEDQAGIVPRPFTDRRASGSPYPRGADSQPGFGWHGGCGTPVAVRRTRRRGDDAMWKTVIRTTACLAVSA